MLKVGASFLYVVMTIVYASYAKSTMLWYGFGQLTLLLFIVVLCLFVIDNKRNTEIERLLLKYVTFMTLCRALYTVYCVFYEDKIVIYNTDVFRFVVTVTFLILIYHIALKYSTIND